MKKYLLLSAVISLLILQAGLPGFGLSQSALVPFPNPGFETNPTGSANGWTWPAGDWIWDKNFAHSGAYSAQVYRGSGDATDSLWSALLPVKPSTVYTLSYWLRTQEATFWPSVSLYQYKSGQLQTGPRYIAHANISAGTSGWNLVQYRFQTMPDAAALQVRVYLPIASGTFWFDDFGLDEEARAIYPFHSGFPVVADGSVFFSSPAVADINEDGAKELLIAGGDSVNGWDRYGAPLPGFPLKTGDKHIQSQIALADLDKDGDLEIAAGTKTPVSDGQGRVFLWHHSGALVGGWPKSVAWNTQYANNESSVSTIVLADIDGDADLEILAGTSNNTAGYSGPTPPASPNLYAWHVNGSLAAGQWPTWHNTAGIYGSIAAGDLNGDGIAEVEVGRDHHFLNVYAADGRSLSGWPVETYVNRNSGRYDLDEHIDYPLSAPTIADLDGDGQMEYIIAGFVGGPGAALLHNSALLVLEPNGTRRPGWETPALGAGILNLEDMSVQAPAVADLDNDGQLEIIVTTNDGWIRAYKANKAILWSFNYTQGDVLGATEPVVGDIDGDGTLEVLFGTRVPTRQAGIYYAGPVGLWALEANGTVTPGFPLPIPTPGMIGAPTLDDLDGDGKLEIMAAAREGAVLVWDTPTTYDPARMPWPTGRHDLRRSAAYLPLNPLEASSISASRTVVKQGETVTFIIHIASNAPVNKTLSMSNTIPAGISYVPGSLAASSGTATQSGGVIRWSGSLPATLAVNVTYTARVTTASPQAIRNTMTIDTGSGGLISRVTIIQANYLQIFVPILKR